jgi:hypothetical protein
LYDRNNINTKDKKEKIILITTMPMPGIKGIFVLRAIAKMAPNVPPDVIPNVDPSARGFLRRPCITAPESERAAPTIAASIALGRRMFIIIVILFSGILLISPVPNKEFTIILKV